MIIGGDFIVKLEINKPEGNQTISNNEKLLQSILDNTETIASSLDTNYGLWTRVNRNKKKREISD